MSISIEEIRDLIREAVQQAAPADDVLERYNEACANSFDPPLSPVTVHRWRGQGLLPPPTCYIAGVPFIKRSERLAALEELMKRKDAKPSFNPAAKKLAAGG